MKLFMSFAESVHIDRYIQSALPVNGDIAVCASIE